MAKIIVRYSEIKPYKYIDLGVGILKDPLNNKDRSSRVPLYRGFNTYDKSDSSKCTVDLADENENFKKICLKYFKFC